MDYACPRDGPMTEMNAPKTILFFGAPGLVAWLGLTFAEPVLKTHGVPAIISWPFFIWAPVLVLFFLVISPYLKSGNITAFKERFWIRPVGKREWLIILAAFLLVQVLELLLQPTGGFLAKFGFFKPPPGIPDIFNPALDISRGLKYLFGVEIKGAWWLIGFWAAWLLVNIVCEEVLWRGYALPLQEQYFGKYAWLINGLSWNILFHFFMRWNVLALLPISLMIPYLVQKYRNIWIGIIIHGTGNFLFFVILVPEIIG